jgi:hypothetical protein
MSISGDSAVGWDLDSDLGKYARRRSFAPISNILTALPTLDTDDPIMPLAAAAQQLRRTITSAISFFTAFYAIYCDSAAKFHVSASRSTIQFLWTEQIRCSISTPSHDWEMQYAEARARCNMKPNRDVGVSEGLSFPQHKKLVLTRVQALAESSLPRLQSHAINIADVGPHSHAHFVEPELDADQDKYADASVLRIKIRRIAADLAEQMALMNVQASATRLVIAELKNIRQLLDTTRKCWDPSWKRTDDVELFRTAPQGEGEEGQENYDGQS